MISFIDMDMKAFFSFLATKRNRIVDGWRHDNGNVCMKRFFLLHCCFGETGPFIANRGRRNTSFAIGNDKSFMRQRRKYSAN